MSWMEGAELRYTIRLEAAHLLLETEVDCAASDGETPSLQLSRAMLKWSDKELPDDVQSVAKVKSAELAAPLWILHEPVITSQYI